MNKSAQFTSPFWNIYLVILIILSFIGILLLLYSQIKAKDNVEDMVDHEWDGIKEYNNPLPKWWFYMFLIAIGFAISYLIYFPGFGSFKGKGNWTSINQYNKEMDKAQAKYKLVYDKFQGMDIEKISKNPEAKKIGQHLFNTYCIQCHGSDAKGAKGFPNLTDNDWLWGGDADSIKETIKLGRIAVMPAWGVVLGTEGIKDVANYVLSINQNKLTYNEERALRGEKVFKDICITCHQADGKGIVGIAPNLTDDVWLWGGREKDIINTITNGHTNEMPSWDKFLVVYAKDDMGNIKEDENGDPIVVDDAKLNILAAYVYGLSK